MVARGVSFPQVLVSLAVVAHRRRVCRRSLARKVPQLDQQGIDLFSVSKQALPSVILSVLLCQKMLTLDPSKRISAKDALNVCHFSHLRLVDPCRFTAPVV